MWTIMQPLGGRGARPRAPLRTPLMPSNLMFITSASVTYRQARIRTVKYDYQTRGRFCSLLLAVVRHSVADVTGHTVGGLVAAARESAGEWQRTNNPSKCNASQSPTPPRPVRAERAFHATHDARSATVTDVDRRNASFFTVRG